MRTAIVAMILLCCCASAFAMAAEYDKNQPVTQQANWPSGLADLLNGQKWVYAFWVNSQDYFYYSGDTDAFNMFVARFATLGASPAIPGVEFPQRGMIGDSYDNVHRMILMPGPAAKTGAFGVAKGATIPYDWEVGIDRGWNEPGKPHRNYASVTLTLCTGGQVKLDKIEVPLNIVVSAPEICRECTQDDIKIAKFIAAHKAKQKAVDNPLADINNLIDFNGRVHTQSGFSDEIGNWQAIYFRGDTAAFNKFLESYSKVTIEPHTVWVVPEQGVITRDPSCSDNLQYDWALSWHSRTPPVAIMDRPDDCVGRGSASNKSQMGGSAHIVLYTDGQVKLDKIEMPLNVDVKTGDGGTADVRKFIAAHEAKQKAAASKGAAK